MRTLWKEVKLFTINFYDILQLKWKTRGKASYKLRTTRFFTGNSKPHASLTHALHSRMMATKRGATTTWLCVCTWPGKYAYTAHNISRVCALDTSTMKYIMRYSENVHFVSKQVTARPRNNRVIGEVNVFSSMREYIFNFIIVQNFFFEEKYIYNLFSLYMLKLTLLEYIRKEYLRREEEKINILFVDVMDLTYWYNADNYYVFSRKIYFWFFFIQECTLYMCIDVIIK